MIKVVDYNNLNEQLKEFGLVVNPKTLVILPTNLSAAKSKKDLFYAETTSTVKVLFRQAGIVETPIEKTKEIPDLALESFDWIGPTIFFASTLINQNPDVTEKAISVISEYLQAWFKGISKPQRNVQLNIVTEKRTGSYKEIHYEGDVEGLKELPKIIRSLHDEQ
jgi:hypothetical protein